MNTSNENDPNLLFFDSVMVDMNSLYTIPSYGIATPDDNVVLMEDKETEALILLLYPATYSDEVLDLVDAGVPVACDPKGFVLLTDEDIEIIGKLYEKLKIERLRSKLEGEQ